MSEHSSSSKYTHELDRLRENHRAITGNSFVHFMCPITLRDEPVELQKGHIINEALKLAARSKVVQRKDVDNHFGSTIEPDFIKWLNANALTLREVINRGRKFTVTLPGGESCEAIPLKARGAGNRLPKMAVCDDDGTPVGEVYVKTTADKLEGIKGLKVHVGMSVEDSAVLGSWLKAAYLAMFRRCGYRYVYTQAGAYVRRALDGFFRSGSAREDAHYFFDRFRGCANFVAGEGVPSFKNTIEHGMAFVHRSEGVIFGLSCLFRANKVLHMVTLPAQAMNERWFSVISKYDKLLQNPKVPQEILPAFVDEDQIRIGPEPLKLNFEGNIDAIRALLEKQLRG